MTNFGANIFDHSQPTPAQPPAEPERPIAPPHAVTQLPADATELAPEPEPIRNPFPAAGQQPDFPSRHRRFARAPARDANRPGDPAARGHERPAPERSRPRPPLPPQADEHPRATSAPRPQTAWQPMPRPERRPAPASCHAAPTPKPSGPSASASTAALVDLDALRAEARTLRGELAMGRLRQALGGARTLTRATAFTTRQDQAPASGFDLAVATDDFAGGMRLAAAAFALAQLHGAIVLAPATPSLRQLAAALQLAGHRVEFASLAPAGDGGTRQLGRECLFVP